MNPNVSFDNLELFTPPHYQSNASKSSFYTFISRLYKKASFPPNLPEAVFCITIKAIKGVIDWQGISTHDPVPKWQHAHSAGNSAYGFFFSPHHTMTGLSFCQGQWDVIWRNKVSQRFHSIHIKQHSLQNKLKNCWLSPRCHPTKWLSVQRVCSLVKNTNVTQANEHYMYS